MNICSHCRTHQPSNDITSCIECGYPIERASENSSEADGREAMDFFVTEASSDSRELVGGQSGARRSGDDLGIESTTDLMEQEAQRENGHGTTAPMTAFDQPIGDSAPPPPPQACENIEDFSTQSQRSPVGTDITQTTAPSGVKRLSDDEVKRIEQNLYGSNGYLKSQEKKELKEKIRGLTENEPAQTTPPPAVETDPSAAAAVGIAPQMAAPQKAKRSQGIAYFYRNYIQVKGQAPLMTNDIVRVNDREYVLKPKKVKSGFVIAGGATALVIFLIVLASVMTGGVASESGQLVGVVLDDNGRPYIEGATIRLPEHGKTVQSDARGFFEAGELPTGTHEIQYIVNGELMQVEYASITPGEIRMVFLKPAPPEEYSQPQPTPAKRAAAPPPQKTETQPVVAQKETVKQEPTPAKTTTTTKSTPKQTTSTTTKPATSTYAKVTLNANVDGARFEVDGSVMGAGNLTYSRIKAGKHSYKVSADGYKPVTGSFTLEGGEERRLAITLSPLEQETKTAQYDTDDFYYSGKTAFGTGDYSTAVADFSRAIEAKPSYADAYFDRAEAYVQLKEAQKAHDDYIRAAEIYQFKKNFGRAITAYSGALDCDRNSLTAYIGRGNALLNKGEVLAAIADFDKSVYIDKRCFAGYYGLGEARFKQQQFSKATSHFKDARSIEPENPLVYQYLMLCYLADNDIKNVKKSYDKFAEVASQEQVDRFRTDQKYSAVVRVVDSQ